jgi:DNA-binding response OmpR family regulator
MPRKKLLLVQDDESVLLALQKAFTQRGWQVFVASTFAKARALLAESPDWVIVDLDLPGGGGKSLVQWIRNEKLPSRVMICAGPNGLVGMADIVALGPDLVMQKPIDLFALLGGIGVVDGN